MIKNAGGLYGQVDVRSLGTEMVTSSRNRTLLKILEDTPYEDGHMVCENRGTGIARMLLALTEAGMERPTFTDNISTFVVEFPNHALLDDNSIAWLTSLPIPPLSRAQMTALVMMRNGGVLTNSAYRASTGVQDSRIATRDLKELVDAGVVEQVGSRGSATYRLTTDASATVPESVAPARSTYGLTGNETRVLDALAAGDLSRSELEQATGMKRDRLQYVLRILREKGRISMVGKARAHDVRWVATPPND